MDDNDDEDEAQNTDNPPSVIDDDLPWDNAIDGPGDSDWSDSTQDGDDNDDDEDSNALYANDPRNGTCVVGTFPLSLLGQ